MKNRNAKNTKWGVKEVKRVSGQSFRFVYSFEHIYEDDNNLNDEYGQPWLKIKENFDRLDDKTKSLVLKFVKRKIYDETVDLKCLNCFYEELNQDWESIEEMWNGIDYPILYCPKCGKPKFVPLEIWKAKKMRR